MVAKPRNLQQAPWISCPGCMKDGSRTLICVKSFQTPKLPLHKKLVDNLWISLSCAGTGRPRDKLLSSSIKNGRNLPIRIRHHAARARKQDPVRFETPKLPPVFLGYLFQLTAHLHAPGAPGSSCGFADAYPFPHESYPQQIL